MSSSFHTFHLFCASPGCILRRDLMQEKNSKILKFNHISKRVSEKQFTGCEAGEDQPAVFGIRVSAQHVHRASFSNQWLNG